MGEFGEYSVQVSASVLDRLYSVVSPLCISYVVIHDLPKNLDNKFKLAKTLS